MLLLRSSQNKGKGQNTKLSKKVKKITFLALHLGYGGAEKAIIAEANILSERYEVEIICAYKLNNEPAFELNEHVKLTYLSESIKPNRKELEEAFVSKNPFAMLREGLKSIQVLYYRKVNMLQAVKRLDTDVLISTRYLYNDLLKLKKNADTITISQEHNYHRNNKRYIKKIVHSVKDIDYFMPVSRELTEFYQARLTNTKCKYIPHSLDYIPEETSKLDCPNIISVGRLSKEKGFVDLVKVFVRVAQDFPDWKLHIVGDGEERDIIKQYIKEYQLKDRIILYGFRDKKYIAQLLSKSSLYVMTSYEESFGIVLIEAQSFGIPCLAYDCARGAHEIISDGKNGYLIPNRDETMMCDKIKELIENKQLRCNMGQAGRQNSLQYAVDNIKEMWFEFIDQM